MDVPDKAGLMRIMASQKKEWYLLNYLMANGHIREKRPGKNYIEFFSRVCCRRNYLGRTGQPKLRTFAAHRENWKLSIKVTNQSKMGDKYIQNI